MLQKLLFTFSFFTFLSLTPLLAQYEQYSGYGEYDSGGRLGLVYIGAPFVYLRGEGFQDVYISEPIREGEEDNKARVNLSEGNFEKFHQGIGIGFVTMKAASWGGGAEIEFLGFENPFMWQAAAYVNYGLVSRDWFIIAPYFKLGYNSINIDLGKAEIQDNKTIKLSEWEHLNGKNAVDVSDGDKFSTESSAIFIQSGLQIAFLLQPNFSVFFQIGIQNDIDISQNLKLDVEGNKEVKEEKVDPDTGKPSTETNNVRGSTELDFDDASLVKLGTADNDKPTPARLDPSFRTGPWYFSLNVAYTFGF